jgi:Domain of unknown function (DUF4337)
MIMSHGVHAVQHEVEHQIEHEEHGHGGGGHGKSLAENMNKKIALLISVIALFLAFSETLGKSAQTEGIGANVEAANLWAFFQAKTIRRTLVETAGREMTVSLKGTTDAAVKTEMEKQIANWTSEGARYRSEPSTQEGSVELAARAKDAEKRRDTHLARYHNYEFGSAAFQIGIVLASAAVITGMIALVWGAIGLGVIGLMFTAMGLFAPHAPHDLMHWVEHLFKASGTH